MREEWSQLAEACAAEVNSRFGHRLMGLPGTWIGSLQADPLEDPGTSHLGRTPRIPTPWSEWHYWWQAHYLDAVIDCGFQHHHAGSEAVARAELRRGRELLRGILLRNFGRFPNYFYDDMAWLALASDRLNDLSKALTGRPSRLAESALNSLTRQLRLGQDSVLDGGLYWSRKRDFKNTPVNGPAALHFARIGDRETAKSLVDWLRRKLFDPQLGLYLDGIYLAETDHRVEPAIYTYNQGPILGAWLELGDPEYLEHASELIEATRTHLRTPGSGLRLEQGGDGNLFTGILCRYLSLAARHESLPHGSRETARQLTWETAQAVAGQQPEQLSAALQRWMILSAAADIDNTKL